jgi:hypothetical protein
MASSGNRRPAADEAEGSRTGARRRRLISIFCLTPYLFRFFFHLDNPLHFFLSRLIQWNPAPAPATTPAMPGDSSGSSSNPYSPSRYTERDALRFKAERDETRHELEDVSKKAGIAELEWEHQRKQLLEAIDGKIL